MTGYRPMTLADLAGRLARTADGKVQWKLVWEFLEEYRWELADIQLSLLQDEPSPTGDEGQVPGRGVSRLARDPLVVVMR